MNRFENSYALLPESFYSITPPTPVADPKLLKWNANRSGNNQLANAAAHLEAALDEVLANPANHTMDMEGSARTDEFGEVLARAVDQ